MIKKTLFILLLLIISLIYFFTQSKKDVITQEPNVIPKKSQPKKDTKIKVDYSKSPQFEKKVELYIDKDTLYNKNININTYKKPPGINNVNKPKSKEELTFDSKIMLNDDKDSIDSAQFKIEKSF